MMKKNTFFWMLTLCLALPQIDVSSRSTSKDKPPPGPQPTTPSRRPLLITGAIAGVALMAGGYIYFYNKTRTEHENGGSPSDKEKEEDAPEPLTSRTYFLKNTIPKGENLSFRSAHGFNFAYDQATNRIMLSSKITMHHYQNNKDNVAGNGWSCLYNNIQTVLEAAKFQNGEIEIPTLGDLALYFHGNTLAHTWLEPASAAKLMGGGAHFEIMHKHKIMEDTNKTLSLAKKYEGAFGKMELITNYKGFERKLRENLYLKPEQNWVYAPLTHDQFKKKIVNHFEQKTPLPVIIDDSLYSYCLIGTAYDQKEGKYYFLYQDPHCPKGRKDQYEKEEMIKYRNEENFSKKKHWMALLPQMESV